MKKPTMNVVSDTMNDGNWQRFGQWLRENRRRADLTQQNVADRTSIHVVQYARIEKGESGTKRDTVIALAKALGLDKEEALLRAGFATQTVAEPKPVRKPQNVAEFFEILDKMGIDVQFDGGYRVLETLDADDLQELLDTMTAAATAKLKRKTSKT